MEPQLEDINVRWAAMHYLLLMVAYFYLYMAFYALPLVRAGYVVHRLSPPIGQLLIVGGLVGLAPAAYRAKLAVDSYFSSRSGFTSPHLDSGEELSANVRALLQAIKVHLSRWLPK